MRTSIELIERADGRQWFVRWQGPNSSGSLWGSRPEIFAATACVITGSARSVPLEPIPVGWQSARRIRLTQRSDGLWIISEGRLYSQCFDACEAIGALAFVIEDNPLPVPYSRLTSHADHVRQQPWAFRRAGQQYLPEGVTNE